MTENWKPVVGYEGLYEVSDLGRVRSLDQVIERLNRWGVIAPFRKQGRVLKAYINTERGGYRYVNLRSGGQQHMCRVAGLVAAAFLGPRPDNHQVCHVNGNPADDRAANLRYGSPRENAADKRLHGTHTCGETHFSARLSEADVRRIKYGGEPPANLAAELGVHPGHVNNIRRGVRWAHV